MKKNTSKRSAAQATNWLTHFRLRSLRVRLALWGLLLLGLTQIIVSGVLYMAISTWLIDQVDHNLLVTSSQVASMFFDPDEEDIPLDIEDIQKQLAGSSNIVAQSFLGEQLFFVRVVNLITGEIAGTSADYDIPTPQLERIEAYYETVLFAGDDANGEIRIHTLPLSYAAPYAVQVGLSLDATHTLQADIGKILILLLFITLSLAPLSGWFLANRALVPIQATVHTAAEINASDLSQRIDLASSEVELELLAQTFNAMLDRIEYAFQRQRQFTADAAHELRTPLSIMQTGLEITLSQQRTANEYLDTLESMHEEVLRMTELANTLLMFARADANQLTLDISKVNLSLLLPTVAEQFATLAQDKQMTINTDIASDLYMDGDEGQLIQLVFNLLDNAIKYTPAGGTVSVVAKNHAKTIDISITDTGIGIPSHAQTHIFERFYRVDESRARSEGGFGLGLAIAKRIVDLHHGTIDVVSQVGQGTHFIVRLPTQYDK